MKSRNIFYAVIITICVFSIIIAVYVQFSSSSKMPKENIIGDLPNNNEKIENIDFEAIKEEFNQAFINTLNQGEFNDIGVLRADESKPIVYTAYNIKETIEGKYDINLNIPLINIVDELVNQMNNQTQEIFANKANEIILGSTTYTIYNIDYAAYVNNNILSVAIKSVLKEGDNAQRLIIQTYNYDLILKKKVTLDEILQQRSISKEDASKRIKSQIKEQARQAEGLKQVGYKVYERDLNSDIYEITSSSSFLYGPNGRLYIIYAYGNSDFTTEFDVVAF